MAHVGKSTELEVHVWNCETLEPVVCLSGFHRRAVRQLAFSPDGKFLLSIGEDNDHSLAVYDWEAKRMVCNTKVDKGVVLGASFLNSNELAVYGPKFIKFFKISGANCTGSRGITGSTQSIEA